VFAIGIKTGRTYEGAILDQIFSEKRLNESVHDRQRLSVIKTVSQIKKHTASQSSFTFIRLLPATEGSSLARIDEKYTMFSYKLYLDLFCTNFIVT